MTISIRIKQAREFRKLSQPALADLVGVTRGACGQWEKGHATPSTQHLAAIAKALGVRFDWLVIGNGDMLVSNDHMGNFESTISDLEIQEQQQEILALFYSLNSKQRGALLNFLRTI